MGQLGDEAAAFLQGVAALDRNVDVEPALPGRFQDGFQLEVVEGALDYLGDGDHVVESRPFRRIEVHHRPIGVLGLVNARVPRVHVDHGVVRQPGQGRDFLDQDPIFETLLVAVAEGGDPVRGVIRLVLDPVTLAVDAVRMRVHR